MWLIFNILINSWQRWLKYWFYSSRWVRPWSQRLGCGRRPLVQEVSSERHDSDADASVWSFPPVAREAVCGRADAGAVPHVHPVQSHERGLPLSPGHVGFPWGDRGSPTQAGLQDSEQDRGLSKPLRTQRHSNVKTARCWHYYSKDMFTWILLHFTAQL